MSGRFTVRANTTNNGGIKHGVSISYDVIYCDANGEWVETVYSNPRVSVKNWLISIGSNPEIAIIEGRR